jgi:hypothetical protein
MATTPSKVEQVRAAVPGQYVQTTQKFGYSSFTNHQKPVSTSHTELDAHPLFINFRHTAEIRKSQTADAIHT